MYVGLGLGFPVPCTRHILEVCVWSFIFSRENIRNSPKLSFLPYLIKWLFFCFINFG